MSNGRDASQDPDEAEHDYDGVVEPEFEGAWRGIEGGGVENEREHEIERREPEGADDGVHVAKEGQRGRDEGGQRDVRRSEKETRQQIPLRKHAFPNIGGPTLEYLECRLRVNLQLYQSQPISTLHQNPFKHVLLWPLSTLEMSFEIQFYT